MTTQDGGVGPTDPSWPIDPPVRAVGGRPDPLAASEPSDLIEISGLRLRCILGIEPQERRDQQEIVIDLVVATDARPTLERDDVTAVWNYRTATKAVIAAVEASTYRTVERLAEQVARICLDHDAPWVQVRVHKPGALRFARTVGVVIQRTGMNARTAPIDRSEGERHVDHAH